MFWHSLSLMKSGPRSSSRKFSVFQRSKTSLWGQTLGPVAKCTCDTCMILEPQMGSLMLEKCSSQDLIHDKWFVFFAWGIDMCFYWKDTVCSGHDHHTFFFVEVTTFWWVQQCDFYNWHFCDVDGVTRLGGCLNIWVQTHTIFLISCQKQMAENLIQLKWKHFVKKAFFAHSSTNKWGKSFALKHLHKETWMSWSLFKLNKSCVWVKNIDLHLVSSMVFLENHAQLGRCHKVNLFQQGSPPLQASHWLTIFPSPKQQECLSIIHGTNCNKNWQHTWCHDKMPLSCNGHKKSEPSCPPLTENI